MSKTRRQKAEAVIVPESVEAFRALAVEHARDLADVAAIEAERELRIAEINKDIEARLARRTPAIATRFQSLKAWWDANGATIAGTKRSAIVAGLNFGHRITPPSLKLAKGLKAVELIARLKIHAAHDLIRIKEDLNKEAIIAVLKRTETHRSRFLANMGFILSQTDEFFIEPVNPAEPAEGEAA